MPVPGGTTEKLEKAFWPHFRNSYRSWFCLYSSTTFLAKALLSPKKFTITEWSMTRSTGTSGLIFSASPPSFCIAQQVFQEHLHGIRQLGDSLQTVFLGGGQAVIDVGLAANLEGLLAFEAIERGHVRKSQLSVIPGKGIRTPSKAPSERLA